MAKIGNDYFQIGYQGCFKKYPYVKKVNSKGVFSIEIKFDQFIYDCMVKKYKGSREYTVSTAKGTGDIVLSGKQLDDVESQVYDTLKELFSPEVKVEYILLVTSSYDFNFWMCDNGEIKPNGVGEKSGYWVNHRGNRPFFDEKARYNLGVGAGVYRKTTRTSSLGTSVTYSEHPGENEVGPWAIALNRFDLNLLNGSSSRNECTGYRPDAVVMPYTEEGAEFFYNVMRTLCALAFSLNNSLADAERIQDHITKFMSGGGVLGLPVGRE